VHPRERVIEIPGSKSGATIRLIMSAPIARILKRARDVGEAKGSRCTCVCSLNIDDVIAHVLQGWAPRNISESYLTRLVLAAGQGVRASQRKVSTRIIELLGADPTAGLVIRD
jgi:hypothetical protein